MLPPEHIDPRIWLETKIYAISNHQSKVLQTLTKKIDVNTLDYFEDAEEEVVTFGKQTDAAALKELVKKKKKFRLAYLLSRIQVWLNMGKRTSISKVSLN